MALLILKLSWNHEKVIPNELKSLASLTFSQMFWLVFVYTQLTASEEKCHFGFDSGKNLNFKSIGEDFFHYMYQSQKYVKIL